MLGWSSNDLGELGGQNHGGTRSAIRPAQAQRRGWDGKSYAIGKTPVKDGGYAEKNWHWPASPDRMAGSAKSHLQQFCRWIQALLEEAWLVDLVPDEVRMRCVYGRRRRRIVQYTVQLEIRLGDEWMPIVRYDNAHGFCHRDTIHADGSQEKTPVFYGDANETFTRAIEDLQTNWRRTQGAIPAREWTMIDPDDFARKQMELAAEFAKYVLEHPDVDSMLPEDSYIYFEVGGEPEFNQYSRELAERHEREDGVMAVCVRVRGLSPPQGSRLIDPQIDAAPNVV